MEEYRTGGFHVDDNDMNEARFRKDKEMPVLLAVSKRAGKAIVEFDMIRGGRPYRGGGLRRQRQPLVVARFA